MLIHDSIFLQIIDIILAVLFMQSNYMYIFTA